MPRRAYDLGIRFIDTTSAHGPGDNWELIAHAFDPYLTPTALRRWGSVGLPAPTA